MRCGELCKSCGSNCNELYQEGSWSEIECTACNGLGAECGSCGGDGFFRLEECPKKMIGQSLVGAINLASYAMKGQWPTTGGMLDQSAWFFDLVQTLESEQNRIDAERMDRNNG